MKVLYLFFLVCILGICAQRRPAKSDGAELEESSQRPVSRGRGRTRFSITQEFEQISPEYEEVTKTLRKTDTSRRKPEHAKPAEKRVLPRPKDSSPKNRAYEVKEVIDDVPREETRRLNKKPRVVTESRFEAVNAPKKDLFTPASPVPEEIPLEFATASVPESIAEETAIPAQLTTLPMNSVVSTEKSAEAESKLSEPLPLNLDGASELPPPSPEKKRKPFSPSLAAPAPLRKSSELRRITQAPAGRSSGRTRGTTIAAAEHPVTQGSRTRTRTPKPARRQEEPSVRRQEEPSVRRQEEPSVRRQEEPSAPAAAPPVRSNFRAGRRRAESVAESSHEPVRTRGPSVFSTENGQESPSRSRTGRKVSSASERKIDQRSGSDEIKTSGRSRGGRITTARATPAPADVAQTRRDSSRITSPVPSPSSLPDKVDFISTRRDGSRLASSTPSLLPEKIDLISTRRDSSRSAPSSTTVSGNAPEKIDLIPTPRDSGRTTPSTTTASERIEVSTRRGSKGRPPQSITSANTQDKKATPRRESRRGGRFTEAPIEKSLTSRNSNKESTTSAPETRSPRRGSSRGTHDRSESTTHQIERQSRGRARTRSFLTLNEQQLEVLPLFEIEPKTVVHTPETVTVPTRTSLGRRRSLNSAEDIALSSTKQTEVKAAVDPISEQAASSTQTSIRVSRQQSISVETKTEKAIRKVSKLRATSPRTRPTRKHSPVVNDSKENQVKESVSVSEVTEVTLTRKFVPRNNKKNKLSDSSKEQTLQEQDQSKTNDANIKKSVKVDEPKVSFRQVVRKATQKLPSKSKDNPSTELTSSQEDIGDSDNYPAPFKAAIQAKKNKKTGPGSRPSQAGEVSITKTIEKSVTSSTASSELASSPTSEASDVENVVNGDEETNHKSESESTTIAASAKFPRPRFSPPSKLPKAGENSPEAAGKSGADRPTFPRKYKPGKSKSITTTQAPDQNEEGASTTPSSLQKFHARFKSRSNKDIVVTPRPAHKSGRYSPKAPKGVYSSRKFARSSTSGPDSTVTETERPKPRKFSIETSALSTKVPLASQGVKKTSRFSSRYRSDILSRSAAHRTSTTVPVYVPTVPTVTPPPTSVKVEENELGMEIISFDDPVANTVPSANLISGEYLSSSTDKTESSTPSTKTDPTSVVTMNKDSESAKVTLTKINSFAKEPKDTAAQTTAKPISIIERIINSITAISTTPPPDSATKTSTSTNGHATTSSAILNLVSKRPKDNDLTIEPSAQKHTRSPNSVDYRTTEKPTTIIEQILSSLSAIRADTAAESTTIDPVQVGSNFNTVDTTLKLSSTESISTIATATVPMSKETATTLPLVSTNTFSTSTPSSSSGSTLGFDTSSTIVPSSDLSTIPIATSSISPRSITITTPLSAQTTTTLSPTNFLDEIASEQTLPKRTIDKLLALLNIVNPTSTTLQPITDKIILVTPKLTTFVTTNTEPVSTDPNATPSPTTLPTIVESTTATTTSQAPSSSEATTPALVTTTLATPADIRSNEVNLFPNPLAITTESSIGSRILDVFSAISRMMTTTGNPSTTERLASTTITSIPTTISGSTTGTPAGTTSLATSAIPSAGTTTVSASTSSPIDLTLSTVTATPETVTTATATGRSLPVSTGITTGSPETGTTPVAFTSTVTSTNAAVTTPQSITTATASGSTITDATATGVVNPLSLTTPVVTTQTGSPSTNSATITSTTADVSTTTSSPTTVQGTTSTQISVVQGAISNVTPANPTSTTIPSNTQTVSTLLTTVNTTPTPTSTTGTPVPLTTTVQQSEATSASTGTTASSIVTSTTKLIPETTTDSTLDVPSTLPTLANFEVSPDRVTVYSANDVSSTFIPDDPATTVSIAARSFVSGTTTSGIAETTTSNTIPSTQNVMSTSQPTVGTTGISSTVVASTTENNIAGSTIAGSTTAATTFSTLADNSNTISGSSAGPTTITPLPTSISSIIASTTSLDNTNAISDSTATSTTLSPVITTITSVNTVNNKLDATTQDVSSNTIDTSSATDKQPLNNQTDVSNLVNPLSTSTNVTENRSSASGMSVSPPPLINSTTTIMMTVMDRDGKVLQFEANPLQNDISSSPEPRDKDYFIFAVLPNNTILRKRPSRFPNKQTPYLIYGVLPNNTLVQKFPNGTIVPMEPVIQVIGFDTRDNPPPPPEIISNQVTSGQESRPDNNKVSTVLIVNNLLADVAQNTVPSSVDANQLSLNGIANGHRQTSTTLLPPLTELLGGRTVKAFNSIVNRTNGDSQTPKVQTLEVDPLTNRVVDIVAQTGNVIYRWKPVTRPNFTPHTAQIGSRINVELNTISSASSPPSPTPAPSTTNVPVTTRIPTSISTDAPFTTPIPLSTSPPVTSTTPFPTTTVVTSTFAPTTTRAPTTTARRPTTAFPSTTFFPTFLTTLFSTLQPSTARITTSAPTTAVPTTTSQAPPTITTTFVPVTTTAVPVATTPVVTTTATATTTAAPVTTTSRVLYTSPVSRGLAANALSVDAVQVTPSSTPPPTTLLELLSRGGASTTPQPTTVLSTTVVSLKDINLKQRKLTEQQKQDLATLEALEKEQEAILQQLAFLTGLNVGNVAPPTGKDNLAERVLQMAANRNKGTGKGASTTGAPPLFNLLESLTPKDSRQSKNIAAPSVEDLVKQINANGLNSVTSPGPIVTSTYGKTGDALLASLLKEYGVGPTTPEALSGAFKDIKTTTGAPKVTSTTKRRATTTAPPGRFMQGINWLLNALAPPPTKRPQPKAKPRPQPSSDNEELFNKQPTEINSVIVQPDEFTTETGASQEQLAALIKILEDIQKDPKKAQDLDIESLRKLQNAMRSGKATGVQVINTSSTGQTSRTFVSTTPSALPLSIDSSGDNDIKPLVVNRGGTGKATTASSVSVSNSILEDVEPTPRGTVPPVNLKDVPGVAADLEAATTRTKIPPVKLNPVPGIPDENPRIRGQLVNYAINVTKAISSFLGSALQGASNRFVNVLSTGSGSLNNLFTSSSDLGNVLNASSSASA